MGPKRIQRGTVCHHCWEFWRQKTGHDPSRCRGKWVSSDGIDTVCMCNCKEAS